MSDDTTAIRWNPGGHITPAFDPLKCPHLVDGEIEAMFAGKSYYSIEPLLAQLIKELRRANNARQWP